MSIVETILLFFVLLIILWFIFFAVTLVLWPIITGFKQAPYVPSFDAQLLLVKKYMKLEKWASIVDLGCGDGKALRFFDKEFGLKGTGYDINPFVVWYGRLSNRILWYPHIPLIRSHFKKAQLSRYDYIYIYLFPEHLISIEDWIFAHMKKDVIIISNSFFFVKHTPFDSIKDGRDKKIIYLYKK